MGGEGSVAAVRPREDLEYHREETPLSVGNNIFSIETSAHQKIVESFLSEATFHPSNDVIDVDPMTMHLLIREKNKIRAFLNDSPEVDPEKLAERGREIREKTEYDNTCCRNLDDESVAEMEEETRVIYEQEIPAVLAEIDRLDTVKMNRHKVHMNCNPIPDQVPFGAAPNVHISGDLAPMPISSII